MKFSKIICLVLSMCMVLFGLVGCTNSTKAVEFDAEEKGNAFLNSLMAGEYETCTKDFSEKVKKAIPADKLKEAWEQTTADSGKFVSVEKTEKKEQDDMQIVTCYLVYEKKGLTVTMSYEKSGLMGGLNINFYEPASSKTSLPDTLEEIDVTVGKDNEYPLAGKITRLKGKQSDVAVVLVHGSGSSNMDEMIFTNKPFRDIAWGLAEKGIDVIRYDKRTYTYGAAMTPEDIKLLTVKEETIDDAVLATKLLNDMGYKTVYLAGHSLGGMLAPRIDSENPDTYAGLILLAGTTRSLMDVIIDQNADVIATLTDQNQITEANKLIDAEKVKLAEMDTWTDKQLDENTIFGMTGRYVKDLNASDTMEIAKKITKPVLVLQGEKDFQVYADKDFSLWKEALKDNSKAVYKLYPGLNHLFMVSQGENKGTVAEYQIESNVDQQVIDDIASFILQK